MHLERTSLGSVQIPLSFDIELDTSFDRTSELSITLDGIDKQSIALKMVCSFNTLNPTQPTSWSRLLIIIQMLKPLNIIILEHDSPWDSIEFLGNDVKEIDNETEILLQLTLIKDMGNSIY